MDKNLLLHFLTLLEQFPLQISDTGLIECVIRTSGQKEMHFVPVVFCQIKIINKLSIFIWIIIVLI
jgi:hypothetical protein